MACRNLTDTEFIRLSQLKHGKRYDYSDVVVVNATTKVSIICKVHGPFMQEPYRHYNEGKGCRKCFLERPGYTTAEYIELARKVHGKKYDYSTVAYKHSQKKIVITCRKHGAFKQNPRTHLEGHGCTTCFQDRNKGTKAHWLKRAMSIHGNRYDYSSVVYRNAKTKVTVICRQHGEFKVEANAHIAVKSGCPRCNESKGETRIRMFLEKHGIPFVQEYRIEPYSYRFDFYVPSLNLLIEFHGRQHYMPIPIFGGESGYRKTVKRDKVKRELALRHEFKMATFSYRSSLSNNLERIIRARLACMGHVFK